MGSMLNPRACLEMLNPGLILLAALYGRGEGGARTDALHLHSALLVHAPGMGDTSTEPCTPRWGWTFTMCLHLQARHPTRLEHPPSFLLMLTLC